MTTVNACSLRGLVLVAVIGPAAVMAQSGAPATKAIQSQETNARGVVAELTECKRKDGVLTVKVRFRNTSTEKVTFFIIEGRNYDKYYVTADKKKYFILTDSEKAPLTAQADGSGALQASLAPGQGFQWWAQYPAPPPTVKSITLFTPLTPPFEDVPIAGE